ncbi:MAG TPA: hypothetical protein PLX21_09185 [Rhodocyclaceae bacterium]|nr:hypothetical protein [Rhodocyclaceae bacterium]HNI82085.1 hypothetical protein [Rhodocyclaceae bacterium]
MKTTRILILAAALGGVTAPVLAEAPNAVTGVVRSIAGATLQVELRGGTALQVEQSDALAAHQVVPGIKVGTAVHATGTRSGNLLRAETVTRAKPAPGTWSPDR